MELKNINSYDELQTELKKGDNVYLLLYKSGSEQSLCAKKSLEEVTLDSDDIKVLAADVAAVRDIHGHYNIKTVPTLIEFEKGEFKNVIKGCLDADYYKAYFENIIYEMKVNDKEDEKPQKTVYVYTTPTCPWCTTTKNYLKKHGIRFTEIDVASDQNAAQAMVSKSGQQGVPQVEINGEMIVGFDRTRINKLLDIK